MFKNTILKEFINLSIKNITHHTVEILIIKGLRAIQIIEI